MFKSRKKLNVTPGLAAGMLLLGLHGAAHADAQPQAKCDTPLRHVLAAAPKAGWSSVIAHLDGELTSARQSQLSVLKADVQRHLPLIQSVALRVPTRRLAALAALPFVTHLSYDGVVKKFDDFTDEHSKADVAQQYGLSGKGIIVAIMDSGVGAGPDFGGRLVSGASFVPGDSRTADLCGHGTHVAGIVGGDGTASTGPAFKHTFRGVAPQAYLASVRVLDDQGQGSVSSVAAGVQYAVAIKERYAPNTTVVMNLSLGHPVGDTYANDPLCQAVEAAWKAGIVVVCAAGNDGRLNAAQAAGAPNEGWGTAYGSIQSPANDPYVITVGATKREDSSKADDKIATYSARGPSRLDLALKPDIVAPGNRVISVEAPGSYLATAYAATNAVPDDSYTVGGTSAPSSAYMQLSGTSMAAPVVAGAAALMLQANPTLSPDTVKARLMVSADKWAQPDGTADPCTFGAGYVDIPAALQSSVTVPAGAYALSPTLSQDSQGNVYLNAAGILSASRCVWGSTALTDLRCVWGSRCIWGTSTNLLSASRCVWGSSVFSDRCVWGSSVGDAADLSLRTLSGE